MGLTATASGCIQVFIVDDQPIVRDGLRARIEAHEGLAVCGEAEDRRAALDGIAAIQPDIVVVEIFPREGDGLELVKQLHARGGPPVIVFSGHDESLYAERCLRAGAMGYVMKEAEASRILDAIVKVFEGELYVSRRVAARVLRSFVSGDATTSGRRSVHGLTDRELEVFRLIGSGKRTSEIARQLNLSVKTVATYRAHIKRKLDLTDHTELMRHAFTWVETGELSEPRVVGVA